MRHGLQKDYDDLKTQAAIFTLNKMAHLTGISSDIFDVSNRSDGSTPSEQDEDESEGICGLFVMEFLLKMVCVNLF